MNNFVKATGKHLNQCLSIIKLNSFPERETYRFLETKIHKYVDLLLIFMHTCEIKGQRKTCIFT